MERENEANEAPDERDFPAGWTQLFLRTYISLGKLPGLKTQCGGVQVQGWRSR